jgi:hypothetical protein
VTGKLVPTPHWRRSELVLGSAISALLGDPEASSQPPRKISTEDGDYYYKTLVCPQCTMPLERQFLGDIGTDYYRFLCYDCGWWVYDPGSSRDGDRDEGTVGRFL